MNDSLAPSHTVGCAKFDIEASAAALNAASPVAVTPSQLDPWSAFTASNRQRGLDADLTQPQQQHVAAAAVMDAPTRTLSQRDRKRKRTFDEQHGSISPTLPISTAAVGPSLVSPPTPPLTAQMQRLVPRERGGGLKVPKSSEHWVAVGVWLASRDFPDVPFFLQLVDNKTGRRLDLPVPYKSIMTMLSPKYTDRDSILLHVRVVQRTDEEGKLLGEVRYLCTDIAVSHQMGDNAFKWIIFQSVALHASPRMCLCSAAAADTLLLFPLCFVRPTALTSFKCAATRGNRR
jgi:hypothetical protein